MPEWLSTLANLLCILGGIVITHSLFLYSQFNKNSEGYLLHAARKLWVFLLLFCAVEWMLGSLFFYLTIGFSKSTSVPVLLFAGVIGLIVAAIPTALEALILPKTGTTVERLSRRLTKLLLKLNIMLRHNFAHAIESCRQQDVFDCQQPSGWGLNIDPRIVGRRIRMLYEFTKVVIAKRRKDPTLLYYDLGRNPWEQFYLVVRQVGRKRVREYIKKPSNTHCPNWDGSERRRTRGSKANRDSSADLNPNSSRLYDDPERIDRIKDGDTGTEDTDSEDDDSEEGNF